MLKAEFHIHTNGDPYDNGFVSYSARDLIKVAAKKKFDVLSITNHNRVFFNSSLKDYARKKGILLIPGAEPLIQGKDVVLVNVSNNDLNRLKKLDDLDKLDDSALVIAPHPYFLFGHCLGRKLMKHIDSFDAIEYSHFYTRAMLNPFFKFLNGNARALKMAKRYNKPVVGTSDAHKLYEFGRTYTLVDSAKNKDDIIAAVKKNRIKLVSSPMPISHFAWRSMAAVFEEGLIAHVLKKQRMPDLRLDPFFKSYKKHMRFFKRFK
ncbi:MAG: PHP domain-containing protein [archaeon]